MKNALMFVVLALATTLVAGCAQPAPAAPAPGASATPDYAAVMAEATRIQRQNEDILATANAYNAQMTQTREATVQAGLATQARYAAIQTETRAAITLAAAYAADTATAVATATAGARTQVAISVAQTKDSADAAAFAENQRIIIASNRLALEREQRMNVVRAVAPWVLIALAVLLAGYILWRSFEDRRKAADVLRFEDGTIVVKTPDGGVVDLHRLLHPALTPRKAAYLIPPAEVSGQQMDQNRRQQVIELERVGGRVAGPAREAFAPPAQPAAAAEPDLVVDAEWRVLSDLYQPGKIVLGVNPDGPVLVDPEDCPHLLYAGTTSAGKTRFGLRPLAAQALANGWQVVFISSKRQDFRVFDGLPNARMVFIDQAEQATGYLEAAYTEIQRRNRMLYDANVSTWASMTGRGPRALVVMDEFSNLADAMTDEAGRKALWRALRMATAEGRKCGIHVAVALQDPTWQSMDLPARRNMTPVIFRVQDQAASRVTLNVNGAETLERQHFLARLRQVVHGKAFAPTDDEIQAFVSRHPVNALPAPEWVALPAPAQPAAAGSDSADKTEQIRSLLLDGLSVNRVCNIVFGYTGGSAFAAVSEVKAHMSDTTGTTTTPKTAKTGPQAA